MRDLLILAVFLTTVLPATAQNVQYEDLQRSAQLSFSIETDFSREERLRTEIIQAEQTGASMFGNITARVEGADLVFDYFLDTKADGIYQVKLVEVRNMDRNAVFPLRPEYIFGDVNKAVRAKLKEPNSFRLVNPPDNQLVRELSGRTQITIQVEFYSYPIINGPLGVTVTCNGQSPIFPPLKKSIPHLVGLAAAGGLYIYGQSRTRRSREIYTEDYLTQSTEGAAEVFYQRANAAKRDGQRFKNAAISVAGTAVATYFFRLLLHGERKKLYRDNCKNPNF